MVKYDKLQGYCYTCGRIGHDKKVFKEEKAVSMLNPKLPRYGPGLGVPSAKSLDAIIKENEVRRRSQGRVEEEGARIPTPRYGGWSVPQPQ